MNSYNNYIFMLRGPSGSGKSTRVLNLILFLQQFEKPKEMFIKKEDKLISYGALFERFNIAIPGRLVGEKGSGIKTHWSGLDAFSSIKNIAYGSKITALYNQGTSVVCEGSFAFELVDTNVETFIERGVTNIVSETFVYPDTATLEERIVGRSKNPSMKNIEKKNMMYKKYVDKKKPLCETHKGIHINEYPATEHPLLFTKRLLERLNLINYLKHLDDYMDNQTFYYDKNSTKECRVEFDGSREINNFITGMI